jgi:hypothetical protein
MTYQTLEQSLKTTTAVILSSVVYMHKGQPRNIIKARKLRGKKVFMVVQYTDGRYSTAV